MANKPMPIVGSIVERKPASSSQHKPIGSSASGFPSVQHRSKSAFARTREDLRKASFSRSQGVPKVAVTLASPPPPLPSSDGDGWREQISRENEERVANMTEEEREQERQEILERFGANVGDILRKAQKAREGRGSKMSEATLETTEGHYLWPTINNAVGLTPTRCPCNFRREKAYACNKA